MAARNILNEADILGVRDQLDRAIQNLIERGPEAAAVDSLREAARLLEEIRRMMASQPASPALAATLRELEPRAARSGELLDSAAAFYRGWWQVSPASAEDYTAEGAWASAPRSSVTGNLSLEA